MSQRQLSSIPAGAALRLAFAAFVAGAPLSAQAPNPIQFEQFALPNGLQVILSPDHTAQVVAVSVWYDVGVRDERRDQAGFAHFVENLMFDGSAHVAPGGHLRLVASAGGEASSDTEDDITRYYQVLPSNQLSLALWLEADRLRGLTLNDTALVVERRVIRDERRYRVDNQAYASGFLLGTYTLYDSTGCFGYSHPAVQPQSMTLDSAGAQKVREFLTTYYTPGNARLAVTGDFDPAAARELITRYFGDISAGAAKPAPSCAVGSAIAPARREIHDPNATLPAAGLFFRVPPHNHADTPALELLSIILGQGSRARLAVALSQESGAAAGIQADLLGRRRGPSVFGVFAVANQGVTADSVGHLLEAQIAKLVSGGVTDDELTRARNYFLAGAVNSRQRAQDVAEVLQHAATFLGSPEAANHDPARYQAVTAEDLRRVAATYLKPDSGLRLLILPGGAS